MINLDILDKRIRSVDDIKSFSNINGSEYKLINQKGYFADNLNRFSDLRYLQTGTLTSIANNTDTCFEYNGLSRFFRYFIPAYLLKSDSDDLYSGYRPILTHSDAEMFGLLGRALTIRQKQYPKNIIECCCTRIDYDLDTLEISKIWLGCFAYEPKSVFVNYEIKRQGTWCPFGIRGR